MNFGVQYLRNTYRLLPGKVKTARPVQQKRDTIRILFVYTHGANIHNDLSTWYKDKLERNKKINRMQCVIKVCYMQNTKISK